ncbi:MAG: tat pathway signal sequence domain protein [Betaproteobacteria bacterium]|nr:MAG: tat pathway signal sequence domain protein [Betaproteobacteria bacterium]
MKLSNLLKNGIAALIAITATIAFAQSQNVDSKGVAMKGFDPVSYFVDAKPSQGMETFMAKHEGATYLFSSEKNRDLFIAQPAKYTPQYGGFCAFGAAKGGKFEIDPIAYTVVDNKLYLNKNKTVQKLWTADVPGFISQADRNWPQLPNK